MSQANVFLLCAAVALSGPPATAAMAQAAGGPPTVMVPLQGEMAYKVAGEAFAGMWEKVTGQRPRVLTYIKSYGIYPPPGDIVVIGSDAVNPIVHGLIRDGVVETLGLEYGGDGYRILSVPQDERTLLIVAGGSGRSTIYAVYDFFRKRAGAEYFWDGDVIPRVASLDIRKVDIKEKPHFRYRGLRYFAHRGLHRFQAEHWDFEDWKKEIDWLLKKRFNLFMLRTGIDDLFQRAFPDDVPYPPTDARDPDAQDRSYNDRTSFWPLKYRGELRKKVLKYAFERGLLHPEDTGTLTHWYSHTPTSFFRSNPDFPVMGDQKRGYALPTLPIWDIERETTWDAYWRLTETHIREYGGGTPRLFHTIGMAERLFGKDDRDNLQRKLYVYRKTQQKIREHYPDARLIIAGWDFIGWWKDQDVRQVLTEFDPTKTIIFDYTADDANKVTYKDWNFHRNFPWVFGIFHSFARNSDVHEDYGILEGRLRDCAGDEMCIGLAMWTEISHSDTFLLEYLGDNSWKPEGIALQAAVDRYVRTRYPSLLAGAMKPIWPAFLTASQTLHWTHSGNRRFSFSEAQFRVLRSPLFMELNEQRLPVLKEEYQRVRSGLEPADGVLQGLAGLAQEWYGNELWRRDAIDMGRTVASRAILAAMMAGSLEMETWRKGRSTPERLRALAGLSQQLMDSLAEILGSDDDYSMHASMKRLERAEELNGVQPLINPHTEQTLKSNSENDYCRSHHYELVRHAYQPELEAYWAWVLKKVESGRKEAWQRPAEFNEMARTVQDRFYGTPLAKMAPSQPRGPAQLSATFMRLSGLVKELMTVAR